MAQLAKNTVASAFGKYVSRSVAGMVGVSAYVLADTYFISLSAGADGITALNLVLPVYSLIFALGQMLAVGQAVQFSLARAGGEKRLHRYLFYAILCSVLLSLPFVAAGLFYPRRVLMLLGADAHIAEVGRQYTAFFMPCAPFFMLNFVLNAFVRNDGDPTLAMTATVSSSLFNIVMDYILVFPVGMGMAGAALASGLAPLVGCFICLLHWLSPKNTLQWKLAAPNRRDILGGCRLGISAFIGELSGGVTTMVFNFLILGIAGNVGVAAYGVVANIALVATGMYNGIAQGCQPLVSDFYGRGEQQKVEQVVRLGRLTCLIAAAVLMGGSMALAETVAAVFNHENDPLMAALAVQGIRLYFIGYLFAGLNILKISCLCAQGEARPAFWLSLLRGLVAITACAVIMSALAGMKGVWLSFAAAELLTLAAGPILMKNNGNMMQN